MLFTSWSEFKSYNLDQIERQDHWMDNKKEKENVISLKVVVHLLPKSHVNPLVLYTNQLLLLLINYVLQTNLSAH